MNILSLFDGISCGQIALERANIIVDNYYASEVDKHAIAVTQANYPDTIQLGDIRNIKSVEGIDLLLGGSPCQGFSRSGNQLNFAHPKSILFFEYVRLLKETKAKYFLLENVNMKKEHLDVISSYLKVQLIKINSSLVSAQSRERLYWTNIPFSGNLLDCGINLVDIIEDIPFDNKNFTPIHNSKPVGRLRCIGGILRPNQRLLSNNLHRNYSQGYRIYDINGKSSTLTANGGGIAGKGNSLIGDGTGYRKLTINEVEELQNLPKDYTSCISKPQRHKSIGNGWTVNIISHILKGLPDKFKYDK